MTTKTKASSKTTEFYIFLGAVAAVAITAVVVGQDENTGIDPFRALDALRYITFLSIGYMVARSGIGLASDVRAETLKRPRQGPSSPAGSTRSESAGVHDTEPDKGSASHRRARRDAMNEELALTEATIPSQLDRWDRERVRQPGNDAGPKH